MPDIPLPTRLAELLDQLTKAPALIEQEVRAMQQMPAATVVGDGEVPSAEGKLIELWQQIEQAKTELTATEAKRVSVVEDLSRWKDAVAAASKQHEQILVHVSAAQAQLQRINEEQRDLSLRRSDCEQIIAQAGQAHFQLQQREQSVTEREQSLAAREQSITQLGERLEGTRFWLEHLLPSWLTEDGIVGWRDALMDDAQHPRAASNTAGLLFATLSLFTYAQRDTDTRAIADALRDVGRRLFSWLKERELGDYEASGVAQAWAERINRECDGRCEIEVPVPGTPAQNQTMLYQPRPGVSAQSVASVQSWCVRGAKREVIHRAAVTV